MNRIEYDDLIELYVALEDELDDVLKVKHQHLMDTPEYVKIYRLILGYSAEDFASECNIDTKSLKDIENGKQNDFNITNKIHETISKLIITKKIEKMSVDILSKNYLTIELIKSKNISILAKRQVRHLFFSKITKYWIFIIYFPFLIYIVYSNNTISLYPLIIVAAVVICAILFITWYKKQFFLWYNSIISNFIYLLLKENFLENNSYFAPLICNIYLFSTNSPFPLIYIDIKTG